MTEDLTRDTRDKIVHSAIAAGLLIRTMRMAGVDADIKTDGSPVTKADVAAEDRIVETLSKVVPEIPIVAEERYADVSLSASASDQFFLIDPLDGTKEYIGGKTDYTVNVALIAKGVPVFGVVVAPELRCAFVGVRGNASCLHFDDNGVVTSETSIAVRAPGQVLTVVVSGSHLDSRTKAYLASVESPECLSVGSSLKFCRVAAGDADVYPRLARTMQWDTAAGDAVLRAAGGMTYNMAGTPVVYGPKVSAPDDAHPFANGKFIAFGNLARSNCEREAKRCGAL